MSPQPVTMVAAPRLGPSIREGLRDRTFRCSRVNIPTLSTSWDRVRTSKLPSTPASLYLLPLCGRVEAAEAGLRETDPRSQYELNDGSKPQVKASGPQANTLKTRMRSN